jgi:hypothetical protein
MNRDSDITSEILWRLLFEPFSESDWPSGENQQLQDHPVIDETGADVRSGSIEPSALADLVALDGLTLDFNDIPHPIILDYPIYLTLETFLPCKIILRRY